MTVRIYEFSKKSGIANKDLVKLLQDNNFDVASHMSLLSPEALAFLEGYIAKKPEPVKAKEIIEEKEAKKIEEPKRQFVSESPKVEALKVIEAVGIVPAPMLVADAAARMGKNIADVILSLLKIGIVATKNQVIPEKTVVQLAKLYSIPLLEPKKEEKKEIIQAPVSRKIEGEQVPRLPIVVVIGHVDHGKTTLLDFIRKTRVAAKEKGGITQHLGAYTAKTEHGEIVFLDTPGHEAFALMRGRGVKVADIAILVVAADDGIMPQTLEAIRQAKSVGLPIIVAINKIDKATPSQIEGVKRGLAQHDLLPEEWGGQVVCMPISAKLGTGIAELLDVIILQSQVMELTANLKVPARGFVLESTLEKGRGPVATVICHNGILKVGDCFICGATQGKISSLVDSFGKRVQSAHPSIPVQVAGFSELPVAGDEFLVVSAAEIKKDRSVLQRMPAAAQATRENALNLIIKADNASSKEALLNSITKMSGKAFKEFYIVFAGVGPITESDITLASDTKAIIYSFHTKVEPSAQALAQKLDVTIRSFDIIYKLLEDLEVLAEQGRPVKKVLKKIGEAVVLKVFDIKNLGVIAGAQVKTGIFSKNGKVVIWRGKYKVGEGAIKSLQRDRKPVKEVHNGFECAFMVDGFNEWLVDDRVECYLEVAEQS